MPIKSFQEFINTIKDTNINPSFYYTDYQVVAKHIETFRTTLNILGIVNSSEEFKNRFRNAYEQNNDIIEVTPLFTGVRPDKMVVLETDKNVPKFNSNNVSIDEAVKFLEDVGFIEMIDLNSPLDLKSYFFGVNVGLDSNGRKNRSGKQMENIVLSYIKPVTNNFLAQATIKNVNYKWDTEFSTSSKKNKKFDFVINHKNAFIFIETNFFNTSGSKTDINTRFIKLNEELQEMYNPQNKKIIFMVITDGIGLKKAKDEIQDVFNSVEHVYNIDDLNKGIIDKVINDLD